MSDRHLPDGHPLAGCVEKYWRAHEHFELLNKEIKSLSGKVEFASFREELKTDPEHPDLMTLHILVGAIKDPPLRLATIIGDIVHNLRSSLDHLVFELAFLGGRGKTIPGKVAFPSSLTRANWKGTYVQGTLLKGVLAKHRTMIYRAQPCYRRKDAPTNRTLARRRRSATADLENLWKHDKHRMLQPVALAPFEIKPSISKFRNCLPAGEPRLNPDFLGRPLKVDTEVLAVPLKRTGDNPQVDVKIEITCEIGFRNGLPVAQALAHMGDWVRHILAWFEPEFETPIARRLWNLPRGGWIETEFVRQPRPSIAGWTVERRPV